jgi:integrase
VKPEAEKEINGYSSIQLTLDTYSHVAPGLQQIAVETFDNIML